MSINREPFGRIRPAEQLRPEKFDLNNPFKLSASVGINGTNQRNDVAKVEGLLGVTGDLNPNETDGLTGYYGARLEQGAKRYQKRNNLKRDGLLNPNGPTINSLQSHMKSRYTKMAADGGYKPSGETPPSGSTPPKSDPGQGPKPSLPTGGGDDDNDGRTNSSTPKWLLDIYNAIFPRKPPPAMEWPGWPGGRKG